ncbi:prepilin peptidase [Sphingorhabdus sp.]|uniref:prepilin peptidase n=1 Tax=Sphingorhabdus sp. TaxID=1902408 RepID=UPI00391C4F2A
MVLVAVLGLIWGSFVAALCSRWPRGERVSGGRSYCDHCRSTLAAKDIVPVLSYLWLRGKCRYCMQPIDPRTLYTELAAAAIGVAAVSVLADIQAVSAAIFGWLLLPLFILDMERLWLPNRLVLILAVFGLLVGPLLTQDISWPDRALGGFFGFVSLEAIRQIFRMVRNAEGMGGGDPKLFAAIGIWSGWQALPFVLLLACLFGFGYLLLTQLRRRSTQPQIPFGAFLCLAAFATATTP